MRLIRDVFTQGRRLDRRIEKVIDYAAVDDARLAQEIAEYESTPSVERGLKRFLEALDHGVRLGDVTDVGVWVAGFYGSGKSSFTKYPGFALDPERKIEGEPFFERLARRIEGDEPLRALLRKVAKGQRTAVIMLDLATEQLVESTSESVANVLYFRVAKLYPFLPARFDLVLALIRGLARRTGGTGLRSAIRIVQDLLVDTNRILPTGAVALADRSLYRLATIDDVYAWHRLCLPPRKLVRIV